MRNEYIGNLWICSSLKQLQMGYIGNIINCSSDLYSSSALPCLIGDLGGASYVELCSPGLTCSQLQTKQSNYKY